VAVRSALVGYLLTSCALACSSPSPADKHVTEPDDAAVEIGVPAGADGLEFAPLEPGAELQLHTFGQGGTHVFLGVRCVRFGQRAFVGITLTNLVTGHSTVAPAPARPQLLFCNELEVCDLVPVLVMTGGLTEPDAERDGLPIQIDVSVHNMSGAAASATTEARLSTALL
jgi:hypothetical protein